MTLRPPINPKILRTVAIAGGFTLSESGLVMLDALGREVWRLYANDPDSWVNGSAGCLFIGRAAGNEQPVNSANPSSTKNVGVGDSSLRAMRNGRNNAAFGAFSLTTAYDATGLAALGYQAGNAAVDPIFSTYVGYQAAWPWTRGDYTTIVGASASSSLPLGTGKIVSAFTDYSGTIPGTVKVTTSTAHLRITGDTIAFVLYDSAGLGKCYRGNVTITVIDATNFYFNGVFDPTIFATSGSRNVYVYAAAGGDGNTIVGANTGRGATSPVNCTILGARVQGLSATLTDNIILATGQGTIRSQFDGTSWTLQGGISTPGKVHVGTFTVATLPAGANGDVAFATDGRKNGEGIGAGTGSIVIYSNGAWRRPSDETAIAA